MARSASQIQANIDALENAKATGVKSVTHDGKTVVYRDVSEINSALASEEMALAALGGLKVVRQYRISTHKGL
jgi:hypothetical protein